MALLCFASARLSWQETAPFEIGNKRYLHWDLSEDACRQLVLSRLPKINAMSQYQDACLKKCAIHSTSIIHTWNRPSRWPAIMMDINSSYNEIEEGVPRYYNYFFHLTKKRCGSPCAPQWIRLLVNKSSSRHIVKSPPDVHRLSIASRQISI